MYFLYFSMFVCLCCLKMMRCIFVPPARQVDAVNVSGEFIEVNIVNDDDSYFVETSREENLKIIRPY